MDDLPLTIVDLSQLPRKGYRGVMGKFNLKPGRYEKHFNGVNSTLSDAFYNDFDAAVIKKHETPRDRLMVFMAAQGKTNGEIAKALNISPVTVANNLKQPWARERMQDELREAGRDELKELLKREGSASILKLVDLRDNAESESVRLGATNSILDRLMGKPNQPLEVNQSKPAKELSTEELERLVAQGCGASQASKQV